MKMSQLLHALDVGIDWYNYSLALTAVLLEISKIHTECKVR